MLGYGDTLEYVRRCEGSFGVTIMQLAERFDVSPAEAKGVVEQMIATGELTEGGIDYGGTRLFKAAKTKAVQTPEEHAAEIIDCWTSAGLIVTGHRSIRSYRAALVEDIRAAERRGEARAKAASR